MKKIVTIKTAVMIVELPAKENPAGRSIHCPIDLLDGETLIQAEKRYQKMIGPKEYQWITENGKHKYVCINEHKIPLVVNSYYGPSYEKEIEIKAEDVKVGEQMTLADFGV